MVKVVDRKRKKWYDIFCCERMWRNWQTHKTQNLAVATSCGFKSHHPHIVKSLDFSGLFVRCGEIYRVMGLVPKGILTSTLTSTGNSEGVMR